jgi:hypothetical protein
MWAPKYRIGKVSEMGVARGDSAADQGTVFYSRLRGIFIDTSAAMHVEEPALIDHLLIRA